MKPNRSAACLAVSFVYLMPFFAFGHGSASQDPDWPDRQIRFPDTVEYQTLTVDLHTHSVFSDGHVWPTIRVGEALRDGLDAIAITEHLEWQPHLADIPHPDRNRAFEAAVESALGKDIILIPGSEITRDAPAGHVNAVFITDANALISAPDSPENPDDTRAYYAAAGQWPAQDAMEAANEQGAFVFWNHPYWTAQNPTGIAKIPDFHKKNAKRKLLHGIEIANGDTYSEEAFAIALEHDLTLIGVSDVHNLIDWDYKPHEGGHRPVTLVLAEDRSAESIREALFDRRTVVWFKNMLIAREQHMLPLLESSIRVVGAEYLPNTSVLRVSIENVSDATFLLENKTHYTFMETGDLVTLPPHAVTELHVKPGKQLDTLTLEFEVQNAMVEPGKAPTIELEVTVP